MFCDMPVGAGFLGELGCDRLAEGLIAASLWPANKGVPVAIRLSF
jgi:hypothetical protein